jgi:hypothetical protein
MSIHDDLEARLLQGIEDTLSLRSGAASRDNDTSGAPRLSPSASARKQSPVPLGDDVDGCARRTAPSESRAPAAFSRSPRPGRPRAQRGLLGGGLALDRRPARAQSEAGLGGAPYTSTGGRRDRGLHRLEDLRLHARVLLICNEVCVAHVRQLREPLDRPIQRPLGAPVTSTCSPSWRWDRLGHCSSLSRNGCPVGLNRPVASVLPARWP